MRLDAGDWLALAVIVGLVLLIVVEPFWQERRAARRARERRDLRTRRHARRRH